MGFSRTCLNTFHSYTYAGFFVQTPAHISAYPLRGCGIFPDVPFDGYAYRVIHKSWYATHTFALTPTHISAYPLRGHGILPNVPFDECAYRVIHNRWYVTNTFALTPIHISAYPLRDRGIFQNVPLDESTDRVTHQLRHDDEYKRNELAAASP